MIRWFITLLVCAGMIAGFGYFKYSEINMAIKAQQEQPEYFISTEAAYPEKVSYVATMNTLGTAVAPRHVTLRNELAGYITEVNFTSGASVQQGQVIMQLDISEQLANLASARAEQKLAETIYRRDLNLRKAKAISQDAVDRSLSELKVIKARIQAIESVINRKMIRAPFDGMAGIHQFEVGQYLEPNTVITALVGQSNQVWIDFSVPQFYSRLEKNTPVKVRSVRAMADSEDEYGDAYVIAGDSVVSAAGRSRLYRAMLEGEDLSVLHNTSLEVEVPVSASRQLMSVPAQAVRSSSYGQHVFVLDPAENDAEGYRARSVNVSVIAESGGQLLVEGDLGTEKQVASAGSFKLIAGMLVHINTRSAHKDDAVAETGTWE